MSVTHYYIESIESTLLDASCPGTLPEGRFLPGEIRVTLRNRAGTYAMVWHSPEPPVIGQQVTFTVDES